MECVSFRSEPGDRALVVVVVVVVVVVGICWFSFPRARWSGALF